jgi:hypothetical protein
VQMSSKVSIFIRYDSLLETAKLIRELLTSVHVPHHNWKDKELALQGSHRQFAGVVHHKDDNNTSG